MFCIILINLDTFCVLTDSKGSTLANDVSMKKSSTDGQPKQGRALEFSFLGNWSAEKQPTAKRSKPNVNDRTPGFSVQ
jgi:hypothetical protein